MLIYFNLFWICIGISHLFVLHSVAAQDSNQIFQYFCGYQTYGSPRIEDCHPLLESFAPFDDTGIRVFDEEQMRADHKGSWPGCSGTVGPVQLARAVQMPRFYTSSKLSLIIAIIRR